MEFWTVSNNLPIKLHSNWAYCEQATQTWHEGWREEVKAAKQKREGEKKPHSIKWNQKGWTCETSERLIMQSLWCNVNNSVSLAACFTVRMQLSPYFGLPLTCRPDLCDIFTPAAGVDADSKCWSSNKTGAHSWICLLWRIFDELFSFAVLLSPWCCCVCRSGQAE